MDKEKARRLVETIIFGKARSLAEIHMGDNDELGVMARDLMKKIDDVRPDIASIQRLGAAHG